jgi:hypothetical protein
MRGLAPSVGPRPIDEGSTPAVARPGPSGPLADPRLAHGGLAQNARILRRLQRSPGNAAVVRAMAARRPPARQSRLGGSALASLPGGARPATALTPAPSATPGPSTLAGGPTPLTIQAALIYIPPPPTKEPVQPPEADPRFARAIEKTSTTARRERKHAPAKAKAAEVAKAAVPPANDASSQAAEAQVKKMDAQKPGEFNKKAFIAAVEKAVDAATPGSLKQATEFKESGKAGEIKGKVAGMVTQDKQRVEKGIKDKTKEPPDTSVAKLKPVTPLTPEKPGAITPSVGAAGAMPPQRPATETDLRHGPAAVENEMAEADVTEEQLKESNEPEFEQAVEAKKEAEVHSKEAPAEYRAAEAETLGTAKAGARGDEKAQLTGMHRGRIAGLSKITSSKAGAKSQDEAKRLEVATKVDSIFAKTKTDVTKILDGIEPKMTPIFERGEKQARATFEAHVSARMKAYKKKRYSGVIGKGRWLRDKFRSLPPVVNKFYEEGKALYLGLMTGVIGGVANVVADELKKAKTRITQGRGEVKTYVESLPKNLKKVGKAAQSKMAAEFDSLESDVDSKQDELVNALAEKYTAARKELDERIVALQEANKGLIDKAIDFAKAVINTIRKLKDLLFDVLSRAISAIGKIIRHPIRFLGNLVGAVKSGIMLFKENIEEHLYAGLTKWLFGQLATTGIELPKSLDAKGILGLLLQILGLTWANIRARAVDKLGAGVVARMEEGVEVFKTLKDEGVGGLWKFVADKVGDLKEAIIAPMIDFVKNKIIVAGVMWLVSLLNPASAFIKAAKAIYEIVMFFVERAAQIKEFVDAVLDSIEAIASGGAGGVGKLIEKTLAKMVPVVVGFLAALLGVGGIGEKVRSVVEAIQKPVKAAVDFVLDGALKLGKKLFGGAKALFAKGKAWVKGKVEGGKKWVKAKTQAAKDWAKKKAGIKGKPAAEGGKGGDEAKHIKIAAALATDLKSTPPGAGVKSPSDLKSAKQAQAKSLVPTYQSQLEPGIRLTVDFADPKEVGTHERLDFAIMIAPNTTEKKDSIELDLDGRVITVWIVDEKRIQVTVEGGEAVQIHRRASESRAIQDLSAAAESAGMDQSAARALLDALAGAGLLNPNATRTLLLQHARKEAIGKKPEDFLRDKLRQKTATSAAVSMPAGRERRAGFVNLGPTEWGEQREPLGSLAMVFYAEEFGKWTSRWLQKPENLAPGEIPTREFVWEHPGSPKSVNLGVIELDDAGMVIRIVDVNLDNVPGGAKELAGIMRKAAWNVDPKL